MAKPIPFSKSQSTRSCPWINHSPISGRKNVPSTIKCGKTPKATREWQLLAAVADSSNCRLTQYIPYLQNRNNWHKKSLISLEIIYKIIKKERMQLFIKEGNIIESESEVAQSCPTLYDPMDCSLPGSAIRGIFQARILEWVAISFSKILLEPVIKTGDSMSSEFRLLAFESMAGLLWRLLMRVVLWGAFWLPGLDL